MKPAWLAAKKMHLIYRFTLLVSWCFFKLFYKVRFFGTEYIQPGGGVVAANHTSYFDPPCMAIACPEELHFLAKEELFTVPLFKTAIKLVNAHPIDPKHNLGVLKKVCQLIKGGHKVLIFPEGERTFDNVLGEIKPGISTLISHSNSQIIPAYIDGTYSVWPRARKWPKLGGTIKIIFGPPIYWSDYEGHGKKEAQVLIAQKLVEELKRLKEKLQAIDN